jgi:hypothetical protein
VHDNLYSQGTIGEKERPPKLKPQLSEMRYSQPHELLPFLFIFIYIYIYIYTCTFFLRGGSQERDGLSEEEKSSARAPTAPISPSPFFPFAFSATPIIFYLVFFSFSLGRQHPELFFNGIHSKKKNSKPKEKEENKKYSYVHNIYLYIFSVVILHR